MRQINPNSRLFTSRLVCLNKLRNNSTRFKSDKRPTAITANIYLYIRMKILDIKIKEKCVEEIIDFFLLNISSP
jgi:hypothetical protein